MALARGWGIGSYCLMGKVSIGEDEKSKDSWW